MVTLIPILVIKGGKMEKLYLYKIDSKYSEYIYEASNKVMKAFSTKKTRPFIRYCA